MVLLPMIPNELIFLLQTFVIALFTLISLRIGKEALVSCICTLIVLANLFVLKQVSLWGFDVMSADSFIIGAVLGFNLLHEYFGRALAEKTIWISFFINFVVVALSYFQIMFRPNIYDINQPHFQAIFGPLPRIVVSSILAHISSQYVRLAIYSTLKNRFSGTSLFFRSFLTTIIEQFVDTGIFTFFALHGIVHSLSDIFIVSFVTKIVIITTISPWISLSKLFYKDND